MLKIAVLVSGGGTNLQAIIDAMESGVIKNARIGVVISGKKTAYALERAKNHGIPSCVIRKKDYESAEQYENAMAEAIESACCRLIVLAGFMTVLSENFIKKYKNKIINIHPSLIPSFCGEGFYGLKVHEAALAKGVKVTGATVHYVDEVVDGGEILAQKAVEVMPNDTPEILQKRVMEQAEGVLLPKVIEQLAQKETGDNMTDLETYLKSNTYPGRGILIGKTEKNLVMAYFIMGRSENSRNRVFELFDGGMRTKAYDESKLKDPSLIIYNPVREIAGSTIVTNGDQTDTVWNFMKEGKSFEEALRTREFEPDCPNYTPRISAIADNKTGSFKMSILKSAEGNGNMCIRHFFEYENPAAGEGRFIHTYEHDGNPIPSFKGEPRKVAVSDDMEGFTNLLWNSLNEDNKVSLFVRYVSLENGETRTKIINKNC